MTNNEEKNGRDEKKIVISRSQIPALPPETLKNLLITSKQMQLLTEGSERFVREFAAAIAAQDQIFKHYNQLKIPLEIEKISAVSKSIEKLLTLDNSQIRHIFEGLTFQSHVWKEQGLALSKMAETLKANEKVWQSHIIDISKFALISQASLARIKWDEIGNALELQTKTRNSLTKSFTSFSNAYVKLFDSLETHPGVILSFPPTVSKLPAVEFYNGVSVIDTITLPREPDLDLENESKSILEATKEENDDRLVFLLGEINPKLLIPLQGARLALTSTNPDRVRHFATSLRELFTHVLHTLSPDDEVKAWSNLPGHFENGKLTRKARLLYICRTLNQDKFSDFVEKDIAAVLEFLQLFQRGTHQVLTEYSDLQLRMMLVRMESSIRFLLEIWDAGK